MSEGFVTEVLERVLAQLGTRPGFAMLAPEMKDGTTHYALFLDVEEELPAHLSSVLDAALRKNPHYDYCIQIGQLAPALIFQVRGNPYDQYVARLRERGQRLGDIKPSPLSTLSGWSKVFEKKTRTLHFPK